MPVSELTPLSQERKSSAVSLLSSSLARSERPEGFVERKKEEEGEGERERTFPILLHLDLQDIQLLELSLDFPALPVPIAEGQVVHAPLDGLFQDSGWRLESLGTEQLLRH